MYLVRKGAHKSRLSLKIGMLAMAACLIPTPVRADVVMVTARGTIQSSCALSAQTGFGSANLDADGSVNATALVDCNTPFKVSATSQNGAMKSATTPPSGFANSLPYTLSVSVPLDSGSTVNASCGSATLVTGATSCALSPASPTGLSSGSGVASSKVSNLTLQWTIPTVTRLVAGSYSDVVTIRIAVQQ